MAVRKLALTLILAGFGASIAGCGGSGTPAIANLGTTTPSPTTSVPNSSTTAGSPGAETSGNGAGAKIGASFSVAGSVRQLTTFAACMRANGEPSFPDPSAQGVISAGSLNRASAEFQQALQVCRKDMPGGMPHPGEQAQDLRQAVAFSACMRENGVPDFPDPQPGGSGGLVIHLSPDVDPSSPQFQKAQTTCQKQVPGGGKG